MMQQSPFQGAHVPFQGAHVPFQGAHMPFQSAQVPFQDAHVPFQSAQVPFQSTHVPLDKTTMTLVYQNGVYYNPASKHYGNDRGVHCDRCFKTNLKVCIGYLSYDLCMTCVSNIDDEINPKNLARSVALPRIAPMGSISDDSKNVQTRNNPDLWSSSRSTSFMMQDQFRPLASEIYNPPLGTFDPLRSAPNSFPTNTLQTNGVSSMIQNQFQPLREPVNRENDLPRSYMMQDMFGR